MNAKTILRIALFALFSAALCAFIFGSAMWQEVHQDEHQFVAPATLCVRTGLLPYKDFPLFHVPDLVFIYGALSKLCAYPLLAARTACVLCLIATAWLLATQSRAVLADWPLWARDATAVIAPLFFITSAVFENVSRLAWNHALPVLLVLCAFVLQVKASRVARARTALFVSGFCIGVAMGTRISFAPLLAPFGLAIFFLPRFTVRERWLGAIWFSVGTLLALAPSLWLLAKYPEQFWFGNFTYPKLSLVWRRHPFDAPDLARSVDSQRGFLDPLHEGMKGLPLSKKLRSFWTETFKPNAPVFLAFAVIGLPACVAILFRRSRERFNVLLWFLVMPFLWFGCIAPSRYHEQYFYPLLPFLILATFYGLSFLNPARPLAKASIALAGLLCVASLAIASREPWKILGKSPREWVPIRAHMIGMRLRRIVGTGPGKVLTFAPIYPQEGGLEIYPQFAVGPFAWRSAHLIPAEKRQRLHLVSVFDLDALLAADPPRAIFLRDDDKDINAPLIHFAQTHAFTATKLGDKTVWLPPSPPAPAER